MFGQDLIHSEMTLQCSLPVTNYEDQAFEVFQYYSARCFRVLTKIHVYRLAQLLLYNTTSSAVNIDDDLAQIEQQDVNTESPVSENEFIAINMEGFKTNKHENRSLLQNLS